MSERCCDVCGKVQASDSLLLCGGEELWVCSACWYRLGEIDLAPRCPRCYEALVQDTTRKPLRDRVATRTETK